MIATLIPEPGTGLLLGLGLALLGARRNRARSIG
ncbi:MAG: PEP-CTERM sorting domain-containing protein [Myxococcota bacterium]|nr:PEP-CTERM sorting domain-containing protein [Myxococcota bacterium]